jgi:hypothetical protein
MSEIDKLAIIDHAVETDTVDEHIHANYLALGGKIELDRFRAILKVFYAITLEVYIGGYIPEAQWIEAELRGDINIRQVAWDQWFGFMERVGHDAEDAVRVFHAVDNFGGYS